MHELIMFVQYKSYATYKPYNDIVDWLVKLEFDVCESISIS